MSTTQNTGTSFGDIFKTGIGVWADVEMAKAKRDETVVSIQNQAAQEQSEITGQNMQQGQPAGFSGIQADSAMLIMGGVGALLLVVLAVKG